MPAAADRVALKTMEMFAGMRAAGVKIMAGSDLAASAGEPALHDELVSLVNAGLTSMEALQPATRSPAEFLGRLATEETIEVGKQANLVVLDANPLADIRNTAACLWWCVPESCCGKRTPRRCVDGQRLLRRFP